MLNRKKVTLGFVFVAIALFIVFCINFNSRQKNEIEFSHKKEIIQRKNEKARYVSFQTNEPMAFESNLVVSQTEDIVENTVDSEDSLDNEESSFLYWTEKDYQIKEVAIRLVRDLYSDFDDMDFSQASVSELVFVKSTNSNFASSGYYLAVLRNPT